MFKQTVISAMLLAVMCVTPPAYASGEPGSSAAAVQNTQGKVKVPGVVKDAQGLPVVGATVVEKDSRRAASTDLDGRFTLEVEPQATLVISCIGYFTQEIPLNGRTSLEVVLQEDNKLLEEVVVVGFSTQKKAHLTGAVASVKMEEALGDRPLPSVAAALQGAVPGLLVSSGGNEPGASKSFQIRGAYSIGSGSVIAPLVLIDNVEGDIDMLNPDDIESVTVMKDAASSAIFGARAAGGVILITTKRPKGESTFRLNYNNNFAISSAVNLPKQAPLRTYLQAYKDADAGQYWSLGAPSVDRWLELLDQYQKNPASVQTQGDGIFKDTDGALYYLNEKDLVKNFLESSFQHTHNVSISGGTPRLRYRLSAGFVDHDGVVISDKDSFRRLNVTSFISADIAKWFTQEATLSYSHSKRSSPASQAGSVYGLRLGSYYPEGEMPEGYGLGVDDGLPFFTPRNQVLYATSNRSTYENPRIFLKSILKPFKGFEAVLEYTFDKNASSLHYYTGKNLFTTIQGGADVFPTQDYLRKRTRGTDYNALNVYGTYGWDLGQDHHFKFMAGFNQESSYRETVEVYSYLQAVTEVPSLGGGTGNLTAQDSYNEYAIRGGFFRFNYNYKDKYLLEANGRYDGSSKFPKSTRFGFFPSVSAGWNIAQEGFMASAKGWLEMLKLRASYGVIGNQNISAYTFVPSMNLNNKYTGWLANGDYVTAITSIPDLVSSSFTWEEVAALNVGLDFAFFKNRLSGLVEWFNKDTRGMLAPGMQLPGVVGASAPMQNTADMRTRGWELSLNWRDGVGHFGYRVGLNLSDARSEITKYDSNESKLLSSYYKGQQLGEIWGYRFDGFYSVDDFEDTQSWRLKEGVTAINGANPRPGDVKFKNLRDDEQGENLIYAGLNTLDNPGDRERIGNTTPRYLYGINLGASYKGFDLGVFIQGVLQRDSWIANAITFPMYPDFKFITLYDGLDNYWRPVDAAAGNYTCANPDAQFPRIYSGYGNQSSNYRTSDKYLSDASYLRIKNVSLSYTFPRELVSKISLSAIKAFVNVENLATFSKLQKGIDPETLSWAYPAFRTVSFGVNLTF